MQGNWTKHATGFPSGIAAGGGDTGWDSTAQPTLLSFRLGTGSPVKTAWLPTGTVILETWVYQDASAPAATGNVYLRDISNNVLYVNNAPVATPAITAVSAGALNGNVQFEARAFGIPAKQYAYVGVRCILPHMEA